VPVSTQRLREIVRSLPMFGAVFLVLVLGMQVHELRKYKSEVTRVKAFPRAGQWMPAVDLVSTSGDSVTIGETDIGRAQILIAFNTTCEFCRETIPVWQRVTDSLSRDARGRFDVVWISGSSWEATRSYMARHYIRATVAKMPSEKMLRVYQIRGVPLTIVLDRWGRVAYFHASKFAKQADVDSLFAAAYQAAAADSTLNSVASLDP